MLSIACVCSESANARRMLASTAKLTGAVQHVESHDPRSLWRRLISSTEEPKPDVVLLYHDNAQALALLDRIRSTPDIETLPVVVITPEATASEVIHAMERDADDYLITPVIPQILANRMGAIISRRRNPSPFEAMLLAGKKALKDRNHNLARERFESALRIKPEATSALYYLGLVAEVSGQVDEAKSYYARAAKFRMNLRAQERLCALLMRERNYNAMRPLVDNLCRYVPVSPQWLAASGLSTLEDGQVAEAVKYLHQAHRVWVAGPDDQQGYAPMEGLSRAIQQFSDHPRLRDLCLSIVLDFEKTRPLINRLDFRERVALGMVAMHVARWSEARTFFLKALDNAPDESAKRMIHERLAMTYERAGVGRLAKEHAQLSKGTHDDGV
ncbi:tetratricopeptide repeat protein [Desulfosoma sp.]